MSWILLLGAIFSEIAGTLMLRASQGFKKKIWFFPVLVAYVVSFVLLTFTLNHGMSIAVAYSIWSAIGIACTAILANLLFKDPFNMTMRIGIVIIILGVICLEFGKGL